jgi:poly-gamma-glutamate synthesis protein (capsule biosynthesis protein)
MQGLRVRVGDTMLGRLVADAIAHAREPLFAPEVVAAAAEADVFVLNLECCISERGHPWPDPAKPFFFRAPPPAAERLAEIGVDCVTLANNHALDFGADALLDTLEHLAAAGIAHVGAGPEVSAARAPVVVGGLTVIGYSDHPPAFAAGPAEPGIAYAADLGWVTAAVAAAGRPVLVTPHWGPNMTTEPSPRIRRAARELLGAGATLVAGHSAHVVHGAQPGVIYDMGEFIDDYRVDRTLRNDLGLLFLVDLDAHRLEAVPLKLDHCRTRLARDEDARWIPALGTEATEDGERVVVSGF